MRPEEGTFAPPAEPAPLRLELAEVGAFNRRFLVRLEDGSAVEAVLYREDTLCVSSQVGCAVGCPFCASGADGLGRQLTFEELCAQVEAAAERGHALRRITVSGVGEPLHNARAVLPFLKWCRDRGHPASLTTTGGPLGRLREALRAPHNGLTVSVHAGTELRRRAVVPRGPSLSGLFGTLTEALPGLSGRRRKKTALAYLLLRGENDSEAELDAFAERAVPLSLPIHLYALNPVPTSAHVPVSRERYQRAHDRLRGFGLRVRMSSKARLEANGGCGTLVSLGARKE